jgi:hypothetical protein
MDSWLNVCKNLLLGAQCTGKNPGFPTPRVVCV